MSLNKLLGRMDVKIMIQKEAISKVKVTIEI